MVAATFGVPSTLATTEQQVSPFAAGLQRLIDVHGTRDLASLQAGKRRGAFQQIDYWRQHALRNAIRHLTYTIAPATVHGTDIQHSEQHVEQLALLSSLLTLQPARSPAVAVLPTVKPLPAAAPNVAAQWLASVQGIRAGPQSVFS